MFGVQIYIILVKTAVDGLLKLKAKAITQQFMRTAIFRKRCEIFRSQNREKDPRRKVVMRSRIRRQ